MPYISVVTTVFNSKKYILECIESTKNQSFQNYEHIIVDDGSTDNGLDIINAPNFPNIKIIKPGKVGRAKALNIGLENSQGKYIAILDADDIALPQRLDVQYQYLEANPKIDLVCSNVILINELGLVTGKSNIPQKHLELKNRLLHLNPFAHSSVMYKKEIALKAGKYNQSCLKSIDFNFYLDLLANGANFHGQNESLVKLRSYDTSWGKSDKNALQLKYAILGLIMYYIRENKLPNLSWDRVYNFYNKWFDEKKLANKWEAKKTFRKAIGQLKSAEFAASMQSFYQAFHQDPSLLFYRGSGFNYDNDVKIFLDDFELSLSSNDIHNIK